MNKILESARELKEELIEIRRHIHQNPEVGDHLPKTTEYVMSKLREFGYKPKEICDSGIVATISGKNPSSKTILLRADMDSLPFAEESNCPFKSTNGNVHACGHDMHTTMLLGGAKLLRQYQDEIEGTVKIVFQPNEEGFKGAKKMIEAGVLENPKVDAAMAFHVHSGTPSQVILYGLDTSIAGCIRFRITVHGEGCHGAMPETGVDPINIAAHIFLAVQEITTREISAMESVVVTFGKFAGGVAPNAIPSEVVMEGTIRSLSNELGTLVFKRMEEIASSTAKLFRGSAELEELSSVPPLKNDVPLANELASYMKDIVGDNAIHSFHGGGMGSEDFASYSYKVPSAYFMLGAGTKEENEAYGMPMHHPKVVFNEEILTTGAAMHAYCAINWLKHHKE